MKQPASLILTYHSLDLSGSPVSLTPETFEQHMRWLAENRIPVVPLTEIVNSPGAVALTFDDGFRSFRRSALPVLQELDLPATVFVVTGYCGRTNRWPSQPESIPTLDLLAWSEIEELVRQGVEFGAHTVTHPDLTALEPQSAAREIRQSRVDLEDHTGRPARAFAWPYGLSTPSLRAMAKEEFPVVCGTDLRFLEGTYDDADLPRIDAFYWAHPFWFQRQGSPIGRTYTGVRRLIRKGRSFSSHVMGTSTHRDQG